MSLTLNIEAFNGPLDLLLHLIEKSEIDIYNIPIYDITQQYLEYLNDMQELDMEIASEFLVMASTLIEIKSRMLLPNSSLEELNAEFNEDDPRFDLVSKLIEYKQIKNIAGYLEKTKKEYGEVYFREVDDTERFINRIGLEDESVMLDSELLFEAFNNLISRLDKDDKKRKTFFNDLKRDLFTVDEKLEFLKSFKSGDRVEFLSLFKDEFIKEEVIVTFLALLELLKLKEVRIVQEKQFDDIVIERL